MLERVTSTPAHELIRQRVLEPLGMTSSVAAITDDIRTDLATGYEPVFTDRPAQLRHPLVPAIFTVSSTVDGSIVSNVIDMAAHARLLLNRGRGPIGTVLSEAMFDVLTTPYVQTSEDVDTPYAYGLDIGEDDHGTRIGHSGGMVGYTAFLSEEPASGLGIVILQNGSGDKEHVVRYALDAVRACISEAPLPDVWFPPEPTSIPGAAAFVGDYVGTDGATLRVTADDHGLGSRSPTPPAVWSAIRWSPTPATSSWWCIPSWSDSHCGSAVARMVWRTRRSTATGGSATSATTGTRRTSRPRSGSRTPASIATTIRGCRRSGWCCARAGWRCSSRWS